MDGSPTESETSIEPSGSPSFASVSGPFMTAPTAGTVVAEKVMPSRGGQEAEPGTATVHRSYGGIPPYAVVGQLSYGPATHTTVVTTTTTTTTSFPPFVLPAPRRLDRRDPKKYPLAASPTPESIRNLSFTVNGRPAKFTEPEDGERCFQEYRRGLSTLEASKGKSRSVKHLGSQHQTPDPQAHHGSGLMNRVPTKTSVTTRKRESTPPSIAEAAEIASLHRRNIRPRTTALGQRVAHPLSGSVTAYQPDVLEESTPATPDTDANTSGQARRTATMLNPNMRELRKSYRRKQEDVQQGTLENSGGSQQGILSRSAVPRFPEEWRSRTPRSDSQITPESSHTESSLLTNFHPTQPTVATPPIADTDLEPLASYELEAEGERVARPPALDTTSAQSASLPSPSLSPTTAAANLALSGGFAEVPPRIDLNEGSRSIPRSWEERESDRSSQSRSGKAIALPDLDETRPDTQLVCPQMDLPTMLDSFDSMPDELKTYVMYQLLRRCAKPTLHFVADVVNPALKCDFLGLLPLELSLNIVKYLDFRSMCRAAQVSKKWRQIIDSDDRAWKELLERDGFQLPEGELKRAVKEGWGWQFPAYPDSFEMDLSVSGTKSDTESPMSSSHSNTGYIDSGDAGAMINPTSGRPKRKAAAKFCGSQKKQKRRAAPAKNQTPSWVRSLDSASGPGAHANAAALAVPNPAVGLPSIRCLHLYKSLYQRHYLIRKSWMDPNTTPQHFSFRAHGRHVVTCLQFDTDKILTGSDDTNINVYDTKTGALRTKLEGHEGGVWALQYEGNTLVSGSTDRSVRVWDIEQGICTHVFQGHTSTVRCLVIMNPVEVDEATDGTPIMMPKEPLIITGSRDSTLRVWKLPQPGQRSVYQTGPPANDHDNPYFVRTLAGHGHSVRAIAAHGDTLVSGSYDHTVRVWKISTGENIHRLQGHTQKVYSVVLDHARNRCISGSMDNLVKVWSIENGQCLFNLEGHTSLVGLLDLSHERLVSAAADSTLRIWDPENGRCKATLTAHTGAITCFQHDGQKVISGSDRTLKMWNINTGECTKDLLTDLSGVWQVKFNDRRCVAAVQRNGMTYIEVLDFGAARDGVPLEQRGRRIVVNSKGQEVDDLEPEEAETV